MPAQPHRFFQYLEGRGYDAAWWEECALDGDAPGGGPSPYPWVGVRLGGAGLRRSAMMLRAPLKWGVRAIFLSPLLILLRTSLAHTTPWASNLVTVAFVVLVATFFALLCLYIGLLMAAFLLSRRRPTVDPPFSDRSARNEGIALGPLKVPAAALPLADQRITVQGRVASLGDHLPRERELVRDQWFTQHGQPRRLIEALDFAVVAEGQKPVVVRLESAPLLVGPAQETPAQQAPDLQQWEPFSLPSRSTLPSRENPDTVLTLEEGQQVELMGVPSGEVVDVGSFQLGGQARTLLPEDLRPTTPYRSDTARPATLVTATPASPVWLKVCGS